MSSRQPRRPQSNFRQSGHLNMPPMEHRMSTQMGGRSHTSHSSHSNNSSGRARESTHLQPHPRSSTYKQYNQQHRNSSFDSYRQARKSSHDQRQRRRTMQRPSPNGTGMVQFQSGEYGGSRSRRSHLNRQRSLTRPERQRARQPMIREGGPRGGSDMQRLRTVRRPMVKPPPQAVSDEKFKFAPWTWFAQMVTCCIPGFALSSCGKKDSQMQQAWREKVALCLIIAFFCILLGFVTYGLQPLLCPEKQVSFSYTQQAPDGSGLEKVFREDVNVHGELYTYEAMQAFLARKNIAFTDAYKGLDISALFDATEGRCAEFDKNQRVAPDFQNGCSVTSPYGGTITSSPCIPLAELRSTVRAKGNLVFEWEDLVKNRVDPDPKLFVLNNMVMNMSSYLARNDNYFGPAVHSLIVRHIGHDGTASFSFHPDTKQAMRCIQSRYAVGVVMRDTIGCLGANVVMMITLVVIVCLIVVRFSMAVVFSWCVAPKLVGKKKRLLGGSGQHDPERNLGGGKGSADGVETQVMDSNLYTIMLVTCYSEGEAGLRTTFDSLAATTYSNKHKLLFVICDGLITGSGNDRTTPDMVIDMLTLDKNMNDPKACSYIAIADGEKQHNMAKVYAGHYIYNNEWIPAICIVKCGTPAEISSPKPGNRGKRDSQVLLMSYFQRVLFNDRFTELDYEIFWKMQWLMNGVTPDQFELVLMVDADTKVMPDSLSYMVRAMVNDTTIMGLCGETRIANKRQSWVTMIQVFEYYISHHYAKAFESMFGGVTCLPGCFCMYRIKAPKNGGWVPLLANPDILLEYNQNVVTSLHEKNLLLLGEDRFLSTLMLRTFPKRQMIFVPQAICKTVVPETFSVLLSQRRRWINSTIHNLMELVLVSDLCGIACLSMQFAVFVELIGTVVLPAAIVFTVSLIIASIIGPVQAIPLVLLAAILGLPALLIVVTTRKIVYIMWMFVYLLALPVWNLVLPVYSFWHFDDFSWGQTRKVLGETAGEDHGKKEGEFETSAIVMRKWEEWERERLGLKRGENSHRLTMMSGMPDEANGAKAPAAGAGMLLNPEMLSAGGPVDPRASRSWSGNGLPSTGSSGNLVETGSGRWTPSISPRLSRLSTSNSSPNLFAPPPAGVRTSTYLSPRNSPRASAFPSPPPSVMMRTPTMETSSLASDASFSGGIPDRRNSQTTLLDGGADGAFEHHLNPPPSLPRVPSKESLDQRGLH
ncbi:uncharacterized protein VTP21DRAFT_4924 [Calcarisporiella thermophila]|uniref:uncharacterized protein n=1 Tax=Calcarisporiella thermophila TaxID=911321 RepID=UPI0037430D40